MVLDAARKIRAIVVRTDKAQRVEALAGDVGALVLHDEEPPGVPHGFVSAEPGLAVGPGIRAGLVGSAIGCTARGPFAQENRERIVAGVSLRGFGH